MQLTKNQIIGYQKISLVLKGRKRPKEVVDRIAKAKTGHKRTEEQKIRMSLAHIGYEHTEEHKRKISQAMKGKIKTEEHCKNLSNALKEKYPTEETKKKMSESHKGERNINWNNGSSFEPYSIDWTLMFRREIRKQNRYICQLCGLSGNEVHHIDYNKKNCNMKNLILLCKSCHSRTNHNRNYWEEYINALSIA